jgi:UDP-glucose 4-epimerase
MGATRWIVTGGAGYIGAHVVDALLRSGREAVVVDDFSTGLPTRIRDGVEVIPISVLDTAGLTTALRRVRPAGVVHLAGKKFPSESVADPLLYARENAGGVVSLLEAVRSSGGHRIVFSSSCSVYGTPDVEMVDEDAPTLPESPYGESKLYGERVLTASAHAYGMGVVSLRYFNVVGAAAPELADTSAYNLVPLVFEAMRSGRRPRVFGTDYPTPDGTCVRDYVDVRDVADAHVRAAETLETEDRVAVYNVGRGEGSSVLDVLRAVEAVSGRPLPYAAANRRDGDPARIVGSADRIRRELGWTAQRDLHDMIGSAWDAESRRLAATGG